MIYLNNAATSWPKPAEVCDAVDQYTRHHAGEFGRSNDLRARGDSEVVYECRCALAELFGIAHPARVAFTYNATDAINMALKGLLREGAHLIVSDREHNAVLRPALKLQVAGVIEVSFAPSDVTGLVDPRGVADLIRPNTALVEVVHVSNVTGARNDIAELGRVCAEARVPFMVDASQSAGSVEIDVERDGIGILAAPGHKGLLGPQGTGVLYVAPGLELDTLREGGTGGDSLSPLQPAYLPDRFESGTPNLPGIAGLLEGVRFVSRRGVAAIGEHKRSLVRLLRRELRRVEGLVEYVPSADPTLYAFNLSGRSSEDVCEHLAAQDIAVRGGLHCAPSVHRKMGTLETGMIRVSPGVFSTASDVEACAEALYQYTRGTG